MFWLRTNGTSVWMYIIYSIRKIHFFPHSWMMYLSCWHLATCLQNLNALFYLNFIQVNITFGNVFIHPLTMAVMLRWQRKSVYCVIFMIQNYQYGMVSWVSQAYGIFWRFWKELTDLCFLFLWNSWYLNSPSMVYNYSKSHNKNIQMESWGSINTLIPIFILAFFR